MGPGGNYGIDGLVKLAVVGLIALGICAVAAAIGLPLGIWWLVHHIQLV